MRWFYILMIVAILASLFSALLALMKSGKQSGDKRTVKALTLRVGLSIALFLILAAVKTTELMRP